MNRYSVILRAAVVVALLQVSSLVVLAIDCEVQTLDGNSRARLVSLDTQSLVIRSDRDEKTIRISRLLQIKFPANEVEILDKEFGEVKTKQGSSIRVTDFQVRGDQISLRPLFDLNQEFYLKKSDLKAILLPQSLDDSDWKYWNQACDSNVATDRLIVRGRSSGGLRSIQGFIESIDSEGVNFQLEGESINVGWNRLFGIIFYSETMKQEDSLNVSLSDQSLLVPDSILLDGNVITLAFDNQSVTLPMDVIRVLDYSAGKIFWLGDLPLVKSEWKKSQDIPSFANFDPSFGESFQGLPLSLLHLDPRLEGATKTAIYEKGVALRSGSLLQVSIPPDGRRFKGLVGIDPQTSRSGSVDFKILLGDQMLIQESVVGGDHPVEFDISLSGKGNNNRVLTIQVDASTDGTSGDNLHLVNARITK